MRGLVLTEQPAQSESLKLKLMTSRKHWCTAIVDQCRFKLCDSVSRRPYRKRFRLDSNHPLVAVLLGRGAQCLHVVEEDWQIQGRCPMGVARRNDPRWLRDGRNLYVYTC